MNDKTSKDAKLKRALRDNLKKRKALSRKLGQGDGFSIKLRSRDLVKHDPDEKQTKTDKE